MVRKTPKSFRRVHVARKAVHQLETEIPLNVPDEVLPPDHLRLTMGELPFFRSIIAEFARSEWTPHQIELAAMLARTMAEMDKSQRLLKIEGPVMYTEKGWPITNPRVTYVRTMSSQLLSMRRSLSLTIRSAVSSTSTLRVHREAMKVVEGKMEILADDDLLSKPNTYDADGDGDYTTPDYTTPDYMANDDDTDPETNDDDTPYAAE
jgi:hypothetical protein